MNLDLKNKTAIVCGATQGIGFGIAQKLAKEGVSLILVSRNKKKLTACLERLEWPEKHSFICADFNKPDELNKKLGVYFKKKQTPCSYFNKQHRGPRIWPNPKGFK